MKLAPMMSITRGGRRFSYSRNFDLSDLWEGDMQFPRLEMLHRLLCGTKHPERAVVVDNGSGCWAQLAAVIATMGSKVVVKEPDEGQELFIHQINLDCWLPPEARARISYRSRLSDINAPMSADIVYWTNPSSCMDFSDRHYLNAADYLGRDVRNGGFLVMQVDLDYYRELCFEPQQWLPVFKGEINGVVVPTGHAFPMNTLIIHQRKNGAVPRR